MPDGLLFTWGFCHEGKLIMTHAAPVLFSLELEQEKKTPLGSDSKAKLGSLQKGNKDRLHVVHSPL